MSARSAESAPAHINLTLRLAGHERVGTWSIKDDKELTLEVRVKADGAARIDVIDRQGAAVGEFALDATSKRQIADELAAAVKVRAGAKLTPEQAGEPIERRFDSLLSFGIYEVPADGTVHVPNLTVQVLPRYSGFREGGGSSTDDRVTFIIVDGPKRFWPVIVMLSDEEAARLAAVLRAA